MKRVIKDISKEFLTEFYQNFQGEKTFLQMSEYGESLSDRKVDIFRWGFFEEDVCVGVVQFQKNNARRGVYLHCPQGPLFVHNNDTMWVFFLENYVDFGRTERCDFVRMSPLLPKESESLFISNKWRPAPVHMVNPEKTWVLDITQSEEEILKQMKKTTRYEVRRIEKSGIIVKSGKSNADLDTFWDLHLKTVERHGFVPFSKESTQASLKAFKNNIQIFSAQKEEDVYASTIIIFDNQSAYYHQGASLRQKLPFSYATLWFAIKEAKKRGCRVFNFWGVCDESDTKHPWSGLSKFKRGFGGTEKNYMHVHDFPITHKYWLNWMVEKWRRWKRGY